MPRQHASFHRKAKFFSNDEKELHSVASGCGCTRGYICDSNSRPAAFGKRSLSAPPAAALVCRANPSRRANPKPLPIDFAADCAEGGAHLRRKQRCASQNAAEGWYFRPRRVNGGFRGDILGHLRKGYGVAILTNGDNGGTLINEIEACVAAAAANAIRSMLPSSWFPRTSPTRWARSSLT
jgi:hypothetical protein